ncbi:MAG: hypothetical protein ACTS6G_04175 [Candidatus Hodgkinia cicadicola]
MIKRGTEDREIRKGNRSYVTSAVASEAAESFGLPTEVNQIPLRAERTFNKPLGTVSRSQNTLTPFVLFCGSFGVCLFGLLSAWFGASKAKAKHSTLTAVAEQTMRIPFRAGVCYEATAESAASTSV